MHLTYILLSPTFGMHQYTADLANRAECWSVEASERVNVRTLKRTNVPACHHPNVDLVTTTTLPRDRYAPAVQIYTPITASGTGFSAEGLNLTAYHRLQSSLSQLLSTANPKPSTINLQPSTLNLQPSTLNLQPSTLNLQPSTLHRPPSTVHFTGVHAWNLPLVRALRRRGVHVIHTLHDLDPHHGVRHAALIRLWNRLLIGTGCHILVHGRRYRDLLLARGVPAGRITCAPLLHGFLSAARAWPVEVALGPERNAARKVTALFFGRIETYKGVDTLLAAWQKTVEARNSPGKSGKSAPQDLPASLVIAGPVAPDARLPPLPEGVELRDRRIFDDEGDALFRAANLLVLPYLDATQSALVAAAYAYGLPVIVTAAGALPEYVAEGVTGWVVPPGDPAALSAVLASALADPARLAAMGAAGRAWFNTQRAAEETALHHMYAARAAPRPPNPGGRG